MVSNKAGSGSEARWLNRWRISGQQLENAKRASDLPQPRYKAGLSGIVELKIRQELRDRLAGQARTSFRVLDIRRKRLRIRSQ